MTFPEWNELTSGAGAAANTDWHSLARSAVDDPGLRERLMGLIRTVALSVAERSIESRRVVDAQDVASIVVIRVWRRLLDESIEGTIKDLIPFVRQCARNMCIDVVRKLARARMETLTEEPVDGQPGPEEHAVTREICDRVHAAAERLPLLERGLYDLYVKHKSRTDIMRELEITKGTYGHRYRRLKEYLEQYLSTD